ncbi:MAG: hypothetical protein IPM59_13985 [Chloracidobacterium sp.]|nr:hypothetical protein [Chloracidobacterium sp.]
MGIVGKIVLVIGILGVLLGAAVTVVSMLLVPLTNGRTSWEEAMLGVIPGILVFLASFVMTVVGIILIVVDRKKGK